MLGPCEASATLASTVGSSAVKIVDSTHTPNHQESSLISFPADGLDVDETGTQFLLFTR